MNTRQPEKTRILKLLVGTLLVWGIMILRSFHIQIVEGDYYSERSDKQSLRRVIEKPVRGKIYDRQGRDLAVNANLKSGKKKRELSRLLPHGGFASHLVGYVGTDGHGVMGLEYKFDEELRGLDGWNYKKLDANRKYYHGMGKEGRSSTPGMDMVLTIDLEIQEILEVALENGVKKVDADRGAAVVMDPHTGEILAMGTYPSYDANTPSTLSRKNLKNDVISKVYEPGSTFKLVTAAAALEEKTMDEKDSISGEGGKLVLSNGEVIRDSHIHGMMSISDAMAYSSNVGFAKIASSVGNKRFYRFVRAFGFGNPTGIDLPGEEKGKLRPVNEWSGRTLVTMAMGHEIHATPIQMATAFSAIANGGNLIAPRIVKEWRAPETGEVLKQTQTTLVRKVVSENTASSLRQMLREVVQKGTAKNIKSEWIDFAGKTGTAEKYSQKEKRYLRNSLNSSFIGMAPASAPKYVCLVVVDEPREAHAGSKTAAPIFKEIMEKIFFRPNSKVAPTQLVRGSSKPIIGNWVGLKKQEAQKKADRLGLEIVWHGAGEVVQQQKNLAGSSYENTTKLELKLGNGFKNTMPNLKGLSARDALSLLSESGVVVSLKGAGRVDEQTPKAGTKLQSEQKVSLVLQGET